MSIQWTIIAGYLYLEIAIVVLMILPLFSPRRWHQFFRSRLFSMFQQHAAVYFYVLLGILFMFLMDAVREMRKYSHSSDASHVHLASEMKNSIKLFRAQRNFYITGFSIFLAFVIRRLVTMLIIQDELTIKAEKIIKEAEASVQLAKTTVMKNRMQLTQQSEIEDLKDVHDQLTVAEKMLDDEKVKRRDLEEEAEKWRLMYVELAKNTTANAHGDD